MEESRTRRDEEKKKKKERKIVEGRCVGLRKKEGEGGRLGESCVSGKEEKRGEGSGVE